MLPPWQPRLPELVRIDALVAAGDRPEDAALCFAAADAVRERIGTRTWPSFQAQRDAVLAALRSQLGDTVYDKLVREGRQTDPFLLLDRQNSAQSPPLGDGPN